MITKIKTSVSLSQSLLKELAPFNKNSNMSQFIEQALIYYLAELKKQDNEILNTETKEY